MAVSANMKSVYLENPDLEAHDLKDIVSTGRVLGQGAFGKVIELEMAGTRYAGKQIHGILLGKDILGVERLVKKFAEECRTMAAVKHQNIVQFSGICFLGDSEHPILVMEYMDMSLDHFLQTQKGRIPFSTKYQILLDIIRGLFYLHTRNPTVIHRDLTSKNVLLDKESLKAKIGDLGNALIIDSKQLMVTLTKVPGTAVYMPPEADGAKPDYDSSLDIFSFGHLSLYVSIEVFPEHLLPPTYVEKETGKVLANSEVERRQGYLNILYELEGLGSNHPYCKMIISCLQNDPKKRPTAKKILDVLNDVQSSMEDPYSPLGRANKLDLMEMAYRGSKLTISNKATNISGSVTTITNYQSPQHSPARVQTLQNGEPGVLHIYRKKGGLMGLRGGMEWKQYVFKIENNWLKYYKLNKPKEILGEVNLKSVTQVSIIESNDSSKFCFQMTFDSQPMRSRSTAPLPWKISTTTAEERLNWMEAIKPGSVTALPHMDSPINLGQQEDRSMPHEDLYEIMPAPLPRQSNMAAASLMPILPNGQKISTNPQPHKKEPKTSSGIDEYVELEPIDIMRSIEQLVTPTPPNEYDLISSQPSVKVSLESEGLDNIFESGKSEQDKVASPVNNLPHYDDILPKDIKDQADLTAVSPLQQISGAEPNRQEMVRMYGKMPYSRMPMSLVASGEGEVHPQQYENIIYDNETATRPCKPLPRTAEPAKPKPRIESICKEPIATIESHNPKTSTRPIAPMPKPRKRALTVTAEPQSLPIRSIEKEIRMLVDTDSNDPQSRPEWTKAATTVSSDGSLHLLQHQQLFIPRSKIQNMSEIGQGHYGKVHKAEYIQNDDQKKLTVAVKTIKTYQSQKAHDDFLKEMGIMANFMHPNIVKLYGLVQQSVDSPWIILEYLENGDLRKFLQCNCRPVQSLVRYMLDIATGMDYIAKMGLVHRDIAARNIIVGSDETCKISDFGLLRELPKDDSIYVATNHVPVPVRWMAPESLLSRQFSTASDVWSYGVLLWELSHPSETPYAELLTNLECAARVTQGLRLEIPPNYPDIVKKIMNACWHPEAPERPSFLLISKLLQNIITFNLYV